MTTVTVRADIVVLLCILGVCLTASNAGATASTHIWAPSTDVQRFKSVHVTSVTGDNYYSSRSADAPRPAPVAPDVRASPGAMPSALATPAP